MRTARHRPRPGRTAAAPRTPAAAGSPPHAPDRAGSVTPTAHAHSLSSGAALPVDNSLKHDPRGESTCEQFNSGVMSMLSIDSAAVPCHLTLAISTSLLNLERAHQQAIRMSAQFRRPLQFRIRWGSYRACARDGTGRLVLAWCAEGPAKVRREGGLQRVELRHVTHQQVQACRRRRIAASAFGSQDCQARGLLRA